jgi:putative transposase
MSHSYSSCLMHCVFSIKHRRKSITTELEQRLHAYMGGIARDNRMPALSIGGVEDHVHLLLSLPPTMALAKAMQVIKGCSSKWINDTFPNAQDFEWQEGYGAFSISVSGQADTMAYIANQKVHHTKITFRDELIAFVAKHNLKFDETGWD